MYVVITFLKKPYQKKSSLREVLWKDFSRTRRSPIFNIFLTYRFMHLIKKITLGIPVAKGREVIYILIGAE